MARPVWEMEPQLSNPLFYVSINSVPFPSTYVPTVDLFLTEFRAFCLEHNISYIPGIPDHHQGQGIVETRMRPLAAALIATLGAKAPSDLNCMKTLPRLEFIFNTTYCDGIRGSPYYVKHGREPRTYLSSRLNWDAPNAGA
jgi:hypothetical protein